MQTESGRRRVGGIGLALPLVGDLMVQGAMYRFASNIGLLLKSGIPMLETMHALEAVFQNNPIYREAITHAAGRVSAGRPLATALEETGLFTTMMTNMVKIGEESGQLAAVMDQIAPYYREKMESFIAKLTKLLEPIIIMSMGTTVAGLMLAIYLPMFEMAGKVH
jgi:type IV pilus assembly protein PilC